MAENTAAFNRLKDCRYGKMLYNANDAYVGRSLDLYGEYSEGEMEIFRQLLRPGDVVIEVGANLGAHTIPIAQAVTDKGAVVAFEPQRLTYQVLCANAALNSLMNVIAHNSAVSDAPGTLRVPTLDPMRPQNFGGFSITGHEQGEAVPVVRLDNVAVPSCRLLKIDVEGMELQVLKGATNLIGRLSPAMYIENDRPDRAEALVRYVDYLGYDMFWHLPTLYNPNNFFQNTENVFGNIVSKNMLCFRRGSYKDIQGMPKVEVPPPAPGAPTA